MPGRSHYFIVFLFWMLFSHSIAIPQTGATANQMDQLETLYENKAYSAYLKTFEELAGDQVKQLPAEFFKKAAYCYFSLREFDSSAKYYKLSIKHTSPDDSSFIGCRYADLTLAFINADRLDSARESIRLAMQYVNQVRTEKKHHVYSTCASYLYNTKKYDSALFYLNKGLALLPDSIEGYTEQLTEYYRSIANVYRELGEYNKSINFERKCLELARNSDALACEDKIGIFYNLAITHFMSDNYRRAIELYKQAISKMHKCGDYKKYKTALSNIAYSYWYLDHLDSARAYFDLSLASMDGHNPTSEASLLTNYANFLLLELKDMKESYKTYNKAIHILKNNFGPRHPKLINLYSNLGDLYWRWDHLDSALISYQKALRVIDTSLNQQDYSANPDFHLASDLNTLSLIYRKVRALDVLLRDESWEENRNIYYDALITGVDYYLEAFYDLLERKLFLADQINSMKWEMELIVGIGMDRIYELFQQRNDNQLLQKALDYAEASRSLILKISFYSVLESDKQPASEYNEKLALKRDINRLYFKLSEKDQYTGKQRDSLNTRLVKLMRQYDSLEYSSRKKIATESDPAPAGINIKKVKANLPIGSMLLSYYYSWDGLHIFKIGRQDVVWNRMEADSALDQSIQSIIDFLKIENRFQKGKQKRSYVKQARNLYEQLIPGGIPAGTEQLVFLPDDMLYYFPFELLLTDEPSGDTNYKKLPYLFKSYDIAYHNSLQLMQFKSSNKEKSYGLLAVVQALAKTDTSGNVKLSPINQARQEAQDILKLVNGRLFEPESARLNKLMNLMPQYQLLHFATHTGIDDKNPMKSRLILWQQDTIGKLQNLSAADICNLELKAELVVLSGCETGHGSMLSGEGVISLAWAFQYAGCPAVVMSLNRVDDQATKTIVINYYKNIAKGMRKDRALRLAKINYLENCVPSKSHPGYWTGMISIGNQDPVSLNDRDKAYLLMIPAFFVLLIILIVVRLKRKKQRKSSPAKA